MSKRLTFEVPVEHKETIEAEWKDYMHRHNVYLSRNQFVTKKLINQLIDDEPELNT